VNRARNRRGSIPWPVRAGPSLPPRSAMRITRWRMAVWRRAVPFSESGRGRNPRVSSRWRELKEHGSDWTEQVLRNRRCLGRTTATPVNSIGGKVTAGGWLPFRGFRSKAGGVFNTANWKEILRDCGGPLPRGPERTGARLGSCGSSRTRKVDPACRTGYRVNSISRDPRPILPD